MWIFLYSLALSVPRFVVKRGRALEGYIFNMDISLETHLDIFFHSFCNTSILIWSPIAIVGEKRHFAVQSVVASK